MAIMKLCLVLLLCMLAMRQCIPCEASRKMLMEVEVEGNGGLLPMSRKFLSEEGEEANDMETELMLPDETESEKLDIEQQKEPLEKLEKKEKKKLKEDESMFPESGDGDLPSEGSQDEQAAVEKAQRKKKKKNYGVGEKVKVEVSTEQESTGQLTGENLQEEGKGEIKVEKKVRNDMEEFFTGQTLEEDPSFEMEKEVDEVEGLSGKASLSDIAETEIETSGGAFPSEVGEGDTFTEKLQTEEQSSDVVFPSEHQASSDDTQQYKEEDAKEKSLKSKKSKKEEVGGAVKAKKKIADMVEVSKSKVQDDKTVKGEAVAEEITDEVTPADVIEREMQGGVEDLVTQAVEEEKIVEEKQQAKEEAGTTWTKQQGSLDESKQTEGSKAKKKKPKTPKQPKSEVQVSEEENAEVKGSKSIDDKDIETKVKQKKDKSGNSNSASELQGDSVVTAGETSESQSKQVETQDTAKPKTKKKKVKSSEKPKKEEKSSEKNEKKEMPSDDDETKEGTKDSKLTETKRDKKMPKSEISGEVDINANPEEDTSKKKQGQVEKPSKGTEDELPTIEKQEEKFEVEVQSIAKEAQERAEGSVSAKKTLSSSAQGAQGVDEDDDEYGDFLQDFSDFSTKIQDTALKVADHLGPNIQKFTDTSKVYFNKANQQITESFSPLVGKQFAPFFASLVSYGLLLVPLAVVILLFEHIRALLSLQKVLLFVNIYLAAYFATLLLATFIIGEPMNYFYKSSASGYVHLQLLQALAYIVYLILQTLDLVFTCTSETLPVKVTVVLQWLVAFTVGFHYYVTIFHRAVTLKGPHTNWKIYGIYSIAFLVLCLFARIKRVKKGYSQLGQADTDKKH